MKALTCPSHLIDNNTFIAGQSARAVVSLHGKDIRVAFRNNLILSPARCPLVTIDHDAKVIVVQGNLYRAGGDRSRRPVRRCATASRRGGKRARR